MAMDATSDARPAQPPAHPRLAVTACLVTNIPAPYRVPVFNALARMPHLQLRVMYCAETEPDRHWDLPASTHPRQVLPGRVLTRRGRFIHFNPSVWSALRRHAPQVVVTTGFNPTHLVAWAYARAHRAAHVAMTDGTDLSESGLGALHRFLRRQVYSSSHAFVVASEGGRRLLQGYGVDGAAIHRAPLIANPAVPWQAQDPVSRDIDLLWSGRMVPVKNLDFALRVAAGTADRLGRRIRLSVLGDGEQMARMRELADTLSDRVQTSFAGHVAQRDLPGWYARSRLFLFPTRWDPWGVVANEACEAGVPVIVSPHAGAAGELVIDRVNGRVLPLEAEAWIPACAQLLGEGALWQQMSEAARTQAQAFGLEAAVNGLAGAIFQAAEAVAQPAQERRRSTAAPS